MILSEPAKQTAEQVNGRVQHRGLLQELAAECFLITNDNGF